MKATFTTNHAKGCGLRFRFPSLGVQNYIHIIINLHLVWDYYTFFSGFGFSFNSFLWILLFWCSHEFLAAEVFWDSDSFSTFVHHHRAFISVAWFSSTMSCLDFRRTILVIQRCGFLHFWLDIACLSLTHRLKNGDIPLALLSPAQHYH
ncbi:hypothetical protein EX30DRAFT_84761 [Ascodesmis nigricans]|uniref:Uncharacterized protein n=1 Tax=Ascodesmis nigricans TaxID=341454 RepID=A0A4S2N2V1_9PEZI|nr:hypothetical protein EX30DRAFT_84761 [Ascodesmis nigricans]